MGIVVSRKVGNAVVRNRVRRRLREGLLALFRERSQAATPSPQTPSFDLMIIARPSAAIASFQELKNGLAAALQRGRVAWVA